MKIIIPLLLLVSLTSCSQRKDKTDLNQSLSKKSNSEIYNMANAFYEKQSNENAVIAFEECIERNIKVDTCYFKLGVSYIGLGEMQKGIQKLENCIKVNPRYFKAYFNIAAISYDNHDFQKSIEFYQQASKIEPKNDAVYYGIAASQFALGEKENSKKNCQIALKLNAQNENAQVLIKRLE